MKILFYCIIALMFAFAMGCDEENNNSPLLLGLANSTAINKLSRLHTRTVVVDQLTHFQLDSSDQVLFASSDGDFYVDMPPASDDTIGQVFYIYNMCAYSMSISPNTATTDTFMGTDDTGSGSPNTCIMVIGSSPAGWNGVYFY